MFTFGQTRVRQVRHQSSANSEPKKFARTFQLKSEAEELYLDHRHIRVGFSFTSSQGCQINSLCWAFHLQVFIDNAALARVQWQVDTYLPTDFSGLNPGNQKEKSPPISMDSTDLSRASGSFLNWLIFAHFPGEDRFLLRQCSKTLSQT